jgi:cell division protein FtsA
VSAPSRPLFALDIGTRKVAGVVVEPQGQGLRVLAASVIEHSGRAMLDGQVHKIEAVAQVVSQVKAELEAATGCSLREAAVAAAGRALLTESAVQLRKFPFPTEITHEQVLTLQLTAVRSAQAALRQRRATGTDLYCVGFSPVRFTLDHETLDDLVGHQGREMSVEVLATFLPRQVVDSLMAVLRRAGLAAASLTLEPIAALEATIPLDLRRINLALVDVGAGTSDIALTRAGGVFAYAMVTVAGDEITEKLCEHYLLEFAEGERVKRLLESSAGKALEFTTLLGQRRKLAANEILETVQPSVAELAHAIGERILALNGGAPKAVVMVGGGSATPGLGPALARELGLDPLRVGARGPDFIADLTNPTPQLHGIEGVTPLGIALAAVRGHGMSFINVQLNEQRVQLLSLHQQPTIFDALLAAGRELKSLYPRPGQAVTYTLGGRLQTLPGEPGRPAHLEVNGEEANLDTQLSEGAQILLEEAVDGADAVLRADRLPRPNGPAWCACNDRHLDLELQLARRDRPVAADEILPDRSELDWVSTRTLAELVPELVQALSEPGPAFTVRVNGQVKRLADQPLKITANGSPVGPEYRPRADDRIEWKRSAGVCIRDLVGETSPASRITITINGRQKTLDTGGVRILLNGRPAQQADPVPNQAEITVEADPDKNPILSHALDGVPLTPPKDGASLKLLVDGEPAGFTTPLRDGAKVEVTFA